MLILPTETPLPTDPIEPIHAPMAAHYASFRACLRWDFAFSCAFCLLHESDLVEHGAEGTGLVSIEHVEPQSATPAARHDYANCRLACRFCNGARGKAPVRARDGRTLLDPCGVAWADRFVRNGDRVEARAGDCDAEYTHTAYDLDDPRKQRLRRDRRVMISECLATLNEAPALVRDLLAQAASASGASTLLAAAARLQHSVETAVKQLERYAAIPEDRDEPCRCTVDPLELPAFLRDHCSGNPGR